MHSVFLLFASVVWLFIAGCADKTATVSSQGDAVSRGKYVDFEMLPGWDAARAASGLEVFKKQCAAKTVVGLEALCREANEIEDAKGFFEARFKPLLLEDDSGEPALMTGYFEPQLYGSRHQSADYPYPLYATPDDLVRVELASVLPELSHRYLRGRLENGKVVPYPSRAQINADGIPAKVLCYLSSDIDRFFLHVQGSGRILLDDGSVLFVGHTDRNGHPYSSIGKRMVEEGLIPKEAISLQSIRTYLLAHPAEKRRILESNPSYIFFGTRNRGATGTLGVELTPMHSVAVDRTKIPLGFPIYYAAEDPRTHAPLRNLALAQDTGSAIKGQVRADLFWGYGGVAEAGAGIMKSPLKLWLLVPVHE